MSEVSTYGEARRWHYYFSLGLLVSVAMVLCLRLAYVFLADPHRFPIHHVKISSTYHYLSKSGVAEALTPYVSASYFGLQVTNLKKALYAIPWVKSVKVERIWPDTVKIVLTERVPAAIWNNWFLTADGELFLAQDAVKNSPLLRLKGPQNQAREVLHVYQKLSKILAKYHFSTAELALRENQSWELMLTNGVFLRLGKQAMDTRLERFCRAYAVIFADKNPDNAEVDLRYPSGMAVHWKQMAGE